MRFQEIVSKLRANGEFIYWYPSMKGAYHKQDDGVIKFYRTTEHLIELSEKLKFLRPIRDDVIESQAPLHLFDYDRTDWKIVEA